MAKKIILETKRLCLREFDLNDTGFIIELLNTPNWLAYIGDKNVRTTEDAKRYLEDGSINSYKENGYGLWMVQLKESEIPIGMCGLVNRDTLEDIDIGFAFLPEYVRMGYGFEIADATMKYAKHTLNLKKIVGITDAKNVASIKLLNKIGLQFEKTVEFEEGKSALLFSPSE